MADPYVIFPGTAGNYVSTDDVNLLDADTAHLQQSVGSWVSTGSVGTISLALDGDAEPKFGDYALRARHDGAGGSMNVATGIFPVGTGSVVSFGFWLKSPVTTSAIRVGANEYTGETWLRGVALSFPDLVAGEWQYVTGTYTVGGDADGVDLQVYQASVVSGDSFYVDAVCLRGGTDASFVPSLRVVGDLDTTMDVMVETWGDSSNRKMYLNRYSPTGSDRSWGLSDGTAAGTFLFAVVDQDGVERSSPFPSTSFANGERTVIRTTFTVDDHTVTYYRNGEDLGSAAGGYAGLTSIQPGNFPLTIGGNVLAFAGDVYSAEVRDGIDGPVVARFDAGDVPQPAQLPI